MYTFYVIYSVHITIYYITTTLLITLGSKRGVNLYKV